nr:hypothetical protein [Tanacetum cinerariifolium]
MVLSDNQISSLKSVLDDKAFEDSSNESDFGVDLYLNDEEDNGDNIILPQTPSEEKNKYMFSSINEAIKLMLAVATYMGCVFENDTEKEESKENLKEQEHLEAGSESRSPMLKKENYVPWSSRLFRYAKSRPNGKLIHNSILNGPYIEADDQAIQTILLGLPEDIYAAVDSCETAQETWLRVQQMMKGSDIGIQEKKAKLFNEWERFTSNEGESIESYFHHFLKLMNDLKRNKHFPKKIATDYTQLYDFLKYNQKEVDELKAERLAKTQDPLALMANSNNPYAFPAPHQDQSSFNQNYLQQPMTNPKDITDPTTAMNMALALMAKAFKLNYSTPTNNNQRISSNPRNRKIAQPGQNAGNPAGYNNVIENQVIQNVVQNPKKEEAGIQLQAEEYDLMAAAVDLDEIKEVNANCILMANLQQASTSEEQSTELLKPISKSHQVPQNDNDVISKDTSVEQGRETVE